MSASPPVRIGPSWVQRLLPPSTWWHEVTPATLKADFVAGLTGAIVVLPQGVAFATIAGMPPEYGLYAGMIPAIVAALFGSSRHLVSGPTTAASVVLFSSLSALAIPGTPEYVSLALTLTFMVGLIELILGLARMGVLVNFISHSVVIGFTAGAAILIAAKQLKNFLGIEMPRGGHVHEILLEAGRHIGETNLDVLAIGSVTLFTGIAVRRWFPRIPYMIVAMLVGSLVGVALQRWGGPAAAGIKTVGALPATPPHLSSPDWSWEAIRSLAPTAVAVTLFALTEAVSIARALAARSGQHLDGNQEFIGQGLSNLAGAFFSGYVATGSFNRSGLNYEAGAKTPIAAVLAGALLMAIVVLVAPWAAYLPNAAMAGILFLVAWGLIDFHHIRQIFRASRSETVVMAVTFLSTLFLELEFAIFLGVLLSLVMYLARTSRPTILSRVPNPNLPKRKFDSNPELPECPQLKIVRIDGSLFFGAVTHVQDTLRRFEQENPGQRHLAIIASGINFIDVQGAEFLVQLAERKRAQGGNLYLIRLKGAAWDALDRGGFLDRIGPGNVFGSKGAALRAIFQKLDKDVCRRCDVRIFEECASVPREPAAKDVSG